MNDALLDDNYFMQQALAEARQAAHEGEVPIGALIVCNRQIIARAHNQTERLHDPTAHAEMIAITAAANSLGAKYLRNCAIYVTLEPCLMCAAAIGWAQLSALIYGARDNKKGFSLFPNAQTLHPKTAVTPNILADECAQLLTAFFQSRR